MKQSNPEWDLLGSTPEDQTEDSAMLMRSQNKEAAITTWSEEVAITTWTSKKEGLSSLFSYFAGTSQIQVEIER